MSDTTPPVPPVPALPPAPPAAPSPYAQPIPYGQPNPYAPVYARTNVLAIVSFVASLAAMFFVVVGSITAVITGHIALNQIKRTGEGGHGLALAGVIIGYVGFGLTVIVVALYIVFIVAVVAAGTYNNYSG